MSVRGSGHRITDWVIDVDTHVTEPPGVWVAHCLDLDVVTQGVSLMHALDMALEATRMVLDADAGSGRNPLERRAPQKYWEKLYRLMDKPKKRAAFSELKEDEVSIVALYKEVPELVQPVRSKAKKSAARRAVAKKEGKLAEIAGGPRLASAA